MNFQTSKRIMCCLMAALILCCAVVRPIEASATGLGATLTGATVVGISPGLAVAGILAALGVGAAASGGFDDLVTDIVENIPADFIIETMSGTEMIEGTLYQDVCYVGTEIVEWVNERLYTSQAGETTILSASYTHSGEWANYYEQIKTQWPHELAVAESMNYCTYLTMDNGSKELVYSNSPLNITYNDVAFDELSVYGQSVRFIVNSSGTLSSYSRNYDANRENTWTSDVATSSVAAPSAISSNTTAVTLSDRISTLLDGDTYALWLGNALTLADTTTAVPISLGESITATGAIAQTLAQSIAKAPAISFEKTDDIVYVEVPDVSNDIPGIIALLQAILRVVSNIYQTVTTSHKSWIEAHAQAIIDANSGMLDTSTAVSIANTQAIVDAISGIQYGDFSDVLTDVKTAVISGTTAITGTITDTIADVIAKLAALGLTLAEILSAIKALALSIADAIADVLTAAFVPTPGYFDAKVDSLMNAFPFFSNAMDTATQLKNFLFNLGSTPPIIYIDLAAGSGWYPMGGRTVFVDLTWYSAYKPTMDAVISAFLWLWFVWRLILSLPGIIQGTSGFWGQPLAMNPNGYLPSHGTVNETGITVKK